MHGIILKVLKDPEDNHYCEWSKIADGPQWHGTLDELTARTKEESGDWGVRSLADRVHRANENGTSDMFGVGSWDEDEDLTFEGRGTVPRARLDEFLAMCDSPETTDEQWSEMLVPRDKEDDA